MRIEARKNPLPLLVAAALLFALAPSCSDDTPSGGDATAKTDTSATREGGASDGPTAGDGKPAVDAPSGDAAKPGDSAPKSDSAIGDDASTSCQQSGESCTSAKCCSGLKCCSGSPLPVGVSTCLVTCPKSDVHSKRDFETVDPQTVLDRVMALPVSRWSYRSDRPGVRHIGPMAQDFRRIFKVGSDARFIAPLDGAGVSLAAIQALYRRVQKLELRQAKIVRKNKELRRKLRAIRKRVERPRSRRPTPRKAVSRNVSQLAPLPAGR